MDGTVLIADDDDTIRKVLTQALTRAGCKVHATASLETLLRWVSDGRGDLVISDVVMPDGNGLDELPKIAKIRPGLPVIVISAQNTITTAVRATEADAYDYLPKPFDLPDLMKRAARALDVKRKAKPSSSTTNIKESDDLPLVGRTPAMQAIYRLIAQVMNADIPVLITGESGTGKSLVARAIHDLSDRRTAPFVTATASDLNEADGASRVLTQAKAGTLLFDEVTDLPDDAQARMVRLLDTLPDGGPRIMATSQGNLNRKMNDGGFRPDLFFRLDGVTFAVPALRDRVDDIGLLAEHFLKRCTADGLTSRQLSEDAVDALRTYPWPGNARQLENTVRRLVLTGGELGISRAEVEALLGNQPDNEVQGGKVDANRLAASIEKHIRRYFDLHGGQLPPSGLYQRILREMELPLIEIALDATGGNQAKCAALLGINRNTLRKKISDLDIHVTRRRKLM